MSKEIIGYSHNGKTIPVTELTPVYKTELEVGKWYKRVDYVTNWLMCYSGKHNGYGFNSGKHWGDTYSMFERGYWEPATDKEVEEALINEAKKRGYKEGVTVNTLDNKRQLRTIDSYDMKTPSTNIDYPNSFNLGITTIYRNGQWAEITPYEKIVKLNSEYTAEIKEGFVKVGCQEIPFLAIKELHKAIKKQK